MALAVASHAVFGGVVGPILTVWIGGAVLTLALAAWRSAAAAALPAPVERSVERPVERSVERPEARPVGRPDDVADDDHDRVLAPRLRGKARALGV